MNHLLGETDLQSICEAKRFCTQKVNFNLILHSLNNSFH